MICCKMELISSVRSSNSHPDLLLTHNQTLFQIALDLHFLRNYGYIKAIMLNKGDHRTHLLATCIPYGFGYNRTALQDSAR